MAKPTIIGLIGPCVCCGFADMQVRNDKNGHPYAYCPECSAQVLTHGRPERVKPMIERMRAVLVEAKAPAAPPPIAAPAAAPKPTPAPAAEVPAAEKPKAKPLTLLG